MGPHAYRNAGLSSALRTLGHKVSDLGNITATPVPPVKLDHTTRGSRKQLAGPRDLQ
jgi:hypothetical protein